MTKLILSFGALALWTSSVASFVPLKTNIGTSWFVQESHPLGISLGYTKGDIEPETPLKDRSTSSFRKPVHKNVCAQTGVTLSRYMMDMERLNPELEEVESIFTSIQVGCKAISKLVRTSTLASNTGAVGSINVQGEEQKKMDILANDVLKNALQWAGHFKTIASEEEEEPLVGFMHENGRPEALVDDKSSYIAVS